MLKMMESERRCKIWFNKTNIWANKLEMLNKILDFQQIKFLNWTISWTITSLEIIKSLKLTNSSFKN